MSKFEQLSDDSTDQEMTEKEFKKQFQQDFSYRESPKEVNSYANKLRKINYYYTKSGNAKDEKKARLFSDKAEALTDYTREQAKEIYSGSLAIRLSGDPMDDSINPYHPSIHHTLPLPIWQVNHFS